MKSTNIGFGVNATTGLGGVVDDSYTQQESISIRDDSKLKQKMTKAFKKKKNSISKNKGSKLSNRKESVESMHPAIC